MKLSAFYIFLHLLNQVILVRCSMDIFFVRCVHDLANSCRGFFCCRAVCLLSMPWNLSPQVKRCRPHMVGEAVLHEYRLKRGLNYLYRALGNVSNEQFEVTGLVFARQAKLVRVHVAFAVSALVGLRTPEVRKVFVVSMNYALPKAKVITRV